MGQEGFALLFVFFLAAAVAISLYVQLPQVAFEAQREKEQRLIERGEQYKRAIQLFFRKYRRYPTTLDELENTQGVRFLRRRYKDPMTGKDEWRLIHINAAGVFYDSVAYGGQQKEEAEQQSTNTFITELPEVGSREVRQPVGQQQGPGAPWQIWQQQGASSTAAQASGSAQWPQQAGEYPVGTGTAVTSAPYGFPGGVVQAPEQVPSPAYPSGTIAGAPAGEPVEAGIAPTPGQVEPGDLSAYPGSAQVPTPQAPVQRSPSPVAPGVMPPFVMPGAPPQPGESPQAGSGRGTLPGLPGVITQPGIVPRPAEGATAPALPSPPSSASQARQPGTVTGSFGLGPQVGSGFQINLGAQQAPIRTQQVAAPPPSAQRQVPQAPPAPGMIPPVALVPPPAGIPAPAPQASSGRSESTPVAPPGQSRLPGIPAGQASGSSAATTNPAVEMIQRLLTTPRGTPVTPTAPGGQVIGAGIAGVASTYESPSIKVYGGRSKYNEWEFIYDFRRDRSMQLASILQVQVTGQQGSSGTGGAGSLNTGIAPQTGPGNQPPGQPAVGFPGQQAPSPVFGPRPPAFGPRP